MPNSDHGERRATWASKATVDDQTRQRWLRSSTTTDWVRCGTRWDAVAVHPLQRGLEALDLLDVETGEGYPVLADHLSSRLYVMVPPGTAAAAVGLDGVRVLSDGHQVLVPLSGHGSAAAHWISEPGPGAPRLWDVEQLVGALRERDAADRQAVAS
ncbi:hypothetical protein ACFXOL_10955 [Streptomyces californicus]|uniref:hypothetical protein n=1 Tax=Streptomyces californicus TaxID=67351 RepID=UPI0036574318